MKAYVHPARGRVKVAHSAPRRGLTLTRSTPGAGQHGVRKLAGAKT